MSLTVSSRLLLQALGLLGVTLALGGCHAGAPSSRAVRPSTPEPPAQVDAPRPALRPLMRSVTAHATLAPRTPAVQRLPFALERCDPERLELERVDPAEDDGVPSRWVGLR